MGVNSLTSYMERCSTHRISLTLNPRKRLPYGLIIDAHAFSLWVVARHCTLNVLLLGGNMRFLQRLFASYLYLFRECVEGPITIVVDGCAPANKVDASADRLRRMHVNMCRMGQQVAHGERVSSDGNDPRPLFVAHVFALMAQERGMQVWQARYEADACIAALVRKHPKAVVLSNDSDFFVYGVRLILLSSLMVNLSATEIVCSIYADNAFLKTLDCSYVDFVYFCVAILGNDVLPAYDGPLYQAIASRASVRRFSPESIRELIADSGSSEDFASFLAGLIESLSDLQKEIVLQRLDAVRSYYALPESDSQIDALFFPSLRNRSALFIQLEQCHYLPVVVQCCAPELYAHRLLEASRRRLYSILGNLSVREWRPTNSTAYVPCIVEPSTDQPAGLHNPLDQVFYIITGKLPRKVLGLRSSTTFVFFVFLLLDCCCRDDSSSLMYEVEAMALFQSLIKTPSFRQSPDRYLEFPLPDAVSEGGDCGQFDFHCRSRVRDVLAVIQYVIYTLKLVFDCLGEKTAGIEFAMNYVDVASLVKTFSNRPTMQGAGHLEDGTTWFDLIHMLTEYHETPLWRKGNPGHRFRSFPAPQEAHPVAQKPTVKSIAVAMDGVANRFAALGFDT